MSTEDELARRAWLRREILPLEGRLRRYVQRIAPAGEDVDDLVHDTLLRVISFGPWRQVSAPGAFMRMTARNLVYDILRRRRVVALSYVADLETTGARDEDPGAEARAIGRDELKALVRIVAEMPPQCRKVFTLRKIHGLSPGEIAERMGLSVSTVEKHLVKALRICSEGLARQTGAEADEAHAPGPEIKTRSSQATGG